MIRNNLQQTPSSISTTTTDDNLLNLPDLSAFGDEEKQHILNVLVRDETLRHKHLTRFMQLRKEVAELEQQSQPSSKSICARCRTPFGFIFNTGDKCPKCLTKVCRQCRLMYNVNDNGWLCQLCCKQMLLMSYSGEWIYSIRKSLGKTSSNLQSPTFTRNSTIASNSDLESDRMLPTSPIEHSRYSCQSSSPPVHQKKFFPLTSRSSRIIVQSSVDEQRLKNMQENVKTRPSELFQSQPLAKKECNYISISHLNNTSDDEQPPATLSRNSYDIQPPPPPSTPAPTPSLQLKTKRVVTLKAMHNSQINQTIAGLEPPECGQNDLSADWTVEKYKSNRRRAKIQRNCHSASRDSNQDLSQNSTEQSGRKRLSVSMQSLRDIVYRVPHRSQLPTEQPLAVAATTTTTTTTSERKSESSSNKDQDHLSLKIPKIQSRSNSRSNLSPTQLSVDESRQSPNHSLQGISTALLAVNTMEFLSPLQRTSSLTDSVVTTNSRLSFDESNRKNKPNRLENTRHHQQAIDSDDDIDTRFERARLSSQLSVNSNGSEIKTRSDRNLAGSVELKVSYDVQTHTLDILVKKCSNLVGTKRQQTINPYVKIYLLPGKSKANKRKTMAKKDTTNPVFGETLRYQISPPTFHASVLWISACSQTSLGRNDFLGECYLSLGHCILDRFEEHSLLCRTTKKENSLPKEILRQPSELLFDLTFIENAQSQEIGTIQINAIQGRAIPYRKGQMEIICKGILYPDRIKRKLFSNQKGTCPTWEGALTWRYVDRDNLRTRSIEISLWSRERFRKVMIGLIHLNLSSDENDNKSVKWFDRTQIEQVAWEAFVQQPSKRHRCQLPLRLAHRRKK